MQTINLNDKLAREPARAQKGYTAPRNRWTRSMLIEIHFHLPAPVKWLVRVELARRPLGADQPCTTALASRAGAPNRRNHN